MKTYAVLLASLLILSVSTLLNAQCTPDYTVTDTDLPGEIFPLQLNFKQGVPTSLKLTIIPPPTATQNSVTVNLYRIVLRSLENMPSWLNYNSNATMVESGNDNPIWGYEFVVGNKYCINLWGTPPLNYSVGSYNIIVKVDAYTGNASTPVIVAENAAGDNPIVYTVCASSDTTCWPEKVIDPYELAFKLNKPFSFAMSYVPPPQMYVSGSFYNLSKVVVRQITGLPSWVNYTINAPAVAGGYEMVVGHRYHINFSGTPDSSFIGTGNMVFKMDPYLHNGSLATQNINGEQVPFKVCLETDTLCYPTGIENLQAPAFKLIPFSTLMTGSTASVNFYSDAGKPVTLKIYNILGKQVYSAMMQAAYGANSFEFSCNKFNLGTYIFVISDNKSALKGKLIKIQNR